jgi:exonuclease VII small subunit
MYSLSDGIESQDIQKFNEARALAMSCQAKLDQTQTLLDAYDVARLATPTP